MTVSAWWLIIAYIIGVLSGMAGGTMTEKKRQANKRREEMAGRQEYDNRRWQLVKGGR